MTTNVTGLDFDATARRYHSWRGKPLQNMTRKELEDALVEVDRMYHGALEHIGERRRVQLVPYELGGGAPLGWEAFPWGAILRSIVSLILIGMRVLLPSQISQRTS